MEHVCLTFLPILYRWVIQWVSIFDFVDETLSYDHPNESYWAELSSRDGFNISPKYARTIFSTWNSPLGTRGERNKQPKITANICPVVSHSLTSCCPCCPQHGENEASTEQHFEVLAHESTLFSFPRLFVTSFSPNFQKNHMAVTEQSLVFSERFVTADERFSNTVMICCTTEAQSKSNGGVNSNSRINFLGAFVVYTSTQVCLELAISL